MKKLLSSFLLIAFAALLAPKSAMAAAGIFPSGGGTKTIGSTFTINVTASGGEFNAFQGKISVSGPVSIVSFSAGSANWITQPGNNTTFSGATLGTKISSLTIATIKLKGTSAGNGAVSVSGVILKNGTSTVSTSGGSASFTIQKAPELPGAITVSSSTHPDQAIAYEATTITLSWTKDSKTTGFSYLLDQTADTNPPSAVTDANTSVTYSDKAIGTYYFHVKGKSADGWGPVTHFKITIKEPDPKVNETLSKPTDIKFEKLANFVNDIEKGTFSGFRISGTTEPNFTANLKFTPAITLPEGKTLSVKSDEKGEFQYTIDFPVPAGRYTLAIQGQNEKTLTPETTVIFEISQSKGGSIHILTADDANEPVISKPVEAVKKWYQKINYMTSTIALSALFLLMVVMLIVIVFKNKKARKLLKHITEFK